MSNSNFISDEQNNFSRSIHEDFVSNVKNSASPTLFYGAKYEEAPLRKKEENCNDPGGELLRFASCI